jgi:hypothetical protein
MWVFLFARPSNPPIWWFVFSVVRYYCSFVTIRVLVYRKAILFCLFLFLFGGYF